jgi:hypothetical protein
MKLTARRNHLCVQIPKMYLRCMHENTTERGYIDQKQMCKAITLTRREDYEITTVSVSAKARAVFHTIHSK